MHIEPTIRVRENLLNLYQSSNKHMVRQVSHLMLMYFDNIPVETIGRVLQMSESDINIYIESWGIWQFDIMKNLNTQILLQNITIHKSKLNLISSVGKTENQSEVPTNKKHIRPNYKVEQEVGKGLGNTEKSISENEDFKFFTKIWGYIVTYFNSGTDKYSDVNHNNQTSSNNNLIDKPKNLDIINPVENLEKQERTFQKETFGTENANIDQERTFQKETFGTEKANIDQERAFQKESFGAENANIDNEIADSENTLENYDNPKKKSFIRIIIELPLTIIAAIFAYILSYITAGADRYSGGNHGNQNSSGSTNAVSAIKFDHSNNNIIHQYTTNDSSNQRKQKVIAYENFMKFYKNLRNIAENRSNISFVDDSILKIMFSLLDKYGRRKYISWTIIFSFTIYLAFGGYIKTILSILLWAITLTLVIVNKIEGNKTTEKQVIILPQKDTILSDATDTNMVFTPDRWCKNLAGIGGRERLLMNTDTVNHRIKKYYVKNRDNRLYLHVIVYDNLKYAAYQRSILASKKYDAKILPSYSENKKDTSYFVTIGDFSQEDDWNKLGELRKKWNEGTKIAKFKAIIKTNDTD